MNRRNILLLQGVLGLILFGSFTSAATSLDLNSWIPDVVEQKSDPFDYIAGLWKGTNAEYNFNGDEWALMKRAQTTCSGCTRGGKDVTIQDLKLYVNDKEFWIKAMCYNPVPLGEQYVDRTTGFLIAGTNGGGLCSIKETPYGEFKSACFDSDYFDGSGSAPGAKPPGPANGWFYDSWVRDFPILKSMGVNTLRLYNANPTTRAYSVAAYKKEVENVLSVTRPYGKDHTKFMDLAKSNGFMVIFPLLGDENILTNNDEATAQLYLRNQIDEVGNHEALLMWTVGNELNLKGNEPLRNKIINLMNYAKTYTKTKWDRTIPVTHAVVDNPENYDFLVPTLPVDVFSSNAGYRGLNFQDLWTGNPAQNFSGFTKLSKDYNKPLFISEIGWHQINGSQTAANPGWFNSLYKDMIANEVNGLIGGAFFEYSDEPYSKDDPEQQTMGAVRFVPGTSATTTQSVTTGSNTGTDTGNNRDEEDSAATFFAVSVFVTISSILATIF